MKKIMTIIAALIITLSFLLPQSDYLSQENKLDKDKSYNIAPPGPRPF